MELLGDCNQEVINYLSCEDIINLKKSGEIDNVPDNKLRELLSKKFLDKMMKQYSQTEYPNEDVFSDKKLNSLILRFCFSSLLQKFGYDIDLSSEQIYRMVSILTVEQLEKVNNHLNKDPNWY